MSDKKEENLLTEKDLNEREKDFLKLFNFAFEIGYRKVTHPFGILMQKGSVGFNMQAIYVWTQKTIEGTNKVNCKWVKIMDYTGKYDDFIKKIKELDK